MCHILPRNVQKDHRIKVKLGPWLAGFGGGGSLNLNPKLLINILDEKNSCWWNRLRKTFERESASEAEY